MKARTFILSGLTCLLAAVAAFVFLRQHFHHDERDSHFVRFKQYLNDNTFTTADIDSMQTVMDYFITHPFSVRDYLQKKTLSEDHRAAITAYVVLATLGRIAKHWSATETDSAKQKTIEELLHELELPELLKNSRSMPTVDLSPTWHQWLTVAQNVMMKIIEPSMLEPDIK